MMDGVCARGLFRLCTDCMPSVDRDRGAISDEHLLRKWNNEGNWNKDSNVYAQKKNIRILFSKSSEKRSRSISIMPSEKNKKKFLLWNFLNGEC